MAQIALANGLHDEGVLVSAIPGSGPGCHELTERGAPVIGPAAGYGQGRTLLEHAGREAIERRGGTQPIDLRGSVAASASAAAISVRSIAISSWASETNHASNCDGGSQMPRSSMAR